MEMALKKQELRRPPKLRLQQIPVSNNSHVSEGGKQQHGCHHRHQHHDQHSNVSQWLEEHTTPQTRHNFDEPVTTTLSKGSAHPACVAKEEERDNTSVIEAEQALSIPNNGPFTRVPAPWFGRSKTDVSDHLRMLPPMHPNPNICAPSYGHQSTVITDNKQQPLDPNLPSIISHWWEDRPGTAKLAVPPQYVNATDLRAALPRWLPRSLRQKHLSAAELEQPKLTSDNTRCGSRTSRSEASDIQVSVKPRGTRSSISRRPCTVPCILQTTGGATASDPLSANPPCETGQSARLSISSQDASTATETPRASTGAGSSHQDASTATETPCPSVIISNPRKSKDRTVDAYKHMNPYCIATQKVWESHLNPTKTHTEQMCEKLQSGMRTSLRKGQQRAYAKSC
ncbi:unnamed protein product [Sphagnum jensenii]|uniref:Uncharacterized protein n=1 Tax=Sphagnum jensenii TaxID=128206 RepID=A0ABP0X0F0_9BRYO